MRIAFIGCVESSRVALQALLEWPLATSEVVGVMTRRSSNFNADFVAIAPLAEERRIPLLFVEDAPADEQQAAWLKGLRPDLIFCVGWSRLLGEQCLRVAPGGVVGFHPAALPANRGRHPLVWALALGLQETASTFFYLIPEVDGGPILSQRRIPIAYEDDAQSLYAKVLVAVREQVGTIVQGLADGRLQGVPQNPDAANHWRKRNVLDGQIDWRMDAENVYNLVRALTVPYPGAHFVHDGMHVKVWRCAVVRSGAPNLEPGKVLAVSGREVTVKCGSNAVRLLEHDLRAVPGPGDYL